MIAVFELLELDAKMKESLRNKNIDDFMKTVEKNRKSPDLLTNAFEIARQKTITLSEVMRVAGEQL